MLCNNTKAIVLAFIVFFQLDYMFLPVDQPFFQIRQTCHCINHNLNCQTPELVVKS